MKFRFLSILLSFFPILTFTQTARYVQVIYRNSDKPLDSMEVNFYHVHDGNFIFVEKAQTDSNGLAKVPDNFGREGKVNANSISAINRCIWPVIENVQNFDSGTRLIFADHMMDCGHARIENVYFAFNQYNLIDFYKSKIDGVIEMLWANPEFKIELRGYTDNRGDSVYNKMMSQKRAEAIMAYMLSKGVKKDRIIIKAMGSKWPLAYNERDGLDDPEGRAQNRRVEFKVIIEEPKDGPKIEYEEEKPKFR